MRKSLSNRPYEIHKVWNYLFLLRNQVKILRKGLSSLPVISVNWRTLQKTGNINSQSFLMTSTANNWFYAPLSSTSRLALHAFLIMCCDGFRLKTLTSKHFQSSLCLLHSSSPLIQLPQPVRVSCPWFRLLWSTSINASQSHFPLVYVVQSVQLLFSVAKTHLSEDSSLAASTET